MTNQRKEQIGDATWIYALCEHPTDRVRYVGKTIQHLHERHKAHIRAAIRGVKLPVYYWLRKQINSDKFLTIKALELVPHGEDWVAREKWWIKKFRDDGENLLNLTDGGEGLAGHRFSDEHRRKISGALKKGKHHTCDNCGDLFYRKPKDAKSRHLFCSRKCYQEWQRGKPKDNSSGLMGVAGRKAALDAKARRRANG